MQPQKTLEPVRPHHGRPTACVIAQRYSSTSFVSLRLHYRKEIGAGLKVFLIFSNCLRRGVSVGQYCASSMFVSFLRHFGLSLRT